jgi:hypothetical protein
MALADASNSVVLAPVKATRIGNLVGGVALVVVGAALAGLGGAESSLSPLFWIVFAMGLALVPYGLVLAVRAPGLSVTLTDDSATVRGYLGTQIIPRDSIVGVTRYPSLLWTDASGSRRKTPVNALNVYRRYRVLPEILEQIDEMTGVLRTWATGGAQPH